MKRAIFFIISSLAEFRTHNNCSYYKRRWFWLMVVIVNGNGRGKKVKTFKLVIQVNVIVKKDCLRVDFHKLLLFMFETHCSQIIYNFRIK